MIISIYAIAATYRDSGYRLEVVDHADSYLPQRMEEDKEAIFLTRLEVASPQDRELLVMADAHVQHMRDEVAHAQEKIKDYEAKFLTLSAPTTDELS
jgi:hypothetical protein